MKRTILVLLATAALTAAAVAQSGAGKQAAIAASPAAAREIVLRALKKGEHDLDVRRNYTYQQREVEKELDKDGRVKKTTIETHDVLMVFDEPYEKLIARNDQPLSAKDQQKEEEKLQKAFE